MLKCKQTCYISDGWVCRAVVLSSVLWYTVSSVPLCWREIRQTYCLLSLAQTKVTQSSNYTLCSFPNTSACALYTKLNQEKNLTYSMLQNFEHYLVISCYFFEFLKMTFVLHRIQISNSVCSVHP